MEQVRSEFEAWFKPRKEAMQIRGIATHRIVKLHQRMWEAWQASRAAIEIELPKNKWHPCDCIDVVVAYDKDDVIESIRAAGLRVKEGK